MLFVHFLRDVPIGVLAKAAMRAQEHLGRFLIALELPLEQRNRDLGELPSVRLSISAAMADSVAIHVNGGYLGETLEIVQPILVAMSDLSPVT